MKKKPILRKILIPIMVLVILEILILAGSIFGQGLLEQLTDNEAAIIDEMVDGRGDYLENIMVTNWMNLQYTVNSINDCTERLVEEGTIDLTTLDDSSQNSTPLLLEAEQYLISALRADQVSGVFLILNTDDLSDDVETGNYQDKPGLYLRDSDPTSQYSDQNQDLLVERGPSTCVQDMGIPADSFWRQNFCFGKENLAYYDFLYEPFQAALYNKKNYNWMDMGYWSQPYQLSGENVTAIAYSVPLILSDGTVYGVLGIDITEDYFASMFPYGEIAGDEQGIYFLAKTTENDGEYQGVFGKGNLSLNSEGQDGAFQTNDNYYIYAKKLNIYNTNTAFSDDQWVLAGAVSMSKLTGFGDRMKTTLAIGIFLALLIGVVGCFLVSYLIQEPIAKLSRQIAEQDPRKSIRLEDTGILELDQLSKTFEQLSDDIVESERKFTQIIEMASVSLAGFQINYQNGAVFVTEHFFEIFGRPDLDRKNWNVEEFDRTVDSFSQYFLEKNEMTDSYIFQIKVDGEDRFVKLRFHKDEKNCYGLCEDVTQSILEQKVLKHERDHDLLTNLYNRRAFWREAQNLFQKPETAPTLGAMIMMDLDNLKRINDTYGHNYGDQYIIQAAKAMQDYLPKTALYARNSGDEFYIFIYGFETREEIEQEIRKLKQGIDSMFITLPDQKKQNIKASMGVAWYPDDSSSIEELFRYSDFAMYTVKKNGKGAIRNFDLELYQNQDVINRNKQALTKLIDQKLIQYAFQPIVDARTGKIFAYEALMRPYSSELTDVGNVLQTAREEGKLHAIEELTWFQALEAYVAQIREGNISADSRIFLNSIPNQRLSQEKEKEIQNRYGRYIQKVVMELTEEEQIDQNQWNGKEAMIRNRGGKIAMDDYGTGYNSEKMLLSISPDYIKVDMEIVRDIDQSKDKQAMVSYIVNYAHERNKYIIAEGVETAGEMRTLIELGADYLQGYFLARPNLTPQPVSKEARDVIAEMKDNNQI